MHGTSKGARLLRAFTQVIGDVVPQGMASTRPDEYEPEALSALARFNEFHVGCLLDEAPDVARAIVAQTLEHWFAKDGPWRARVDEVAARLLTAYLAEPADGDEEHS